MHPLRRPHSPASTPKGRAGPSGTARQRGRPSSPQHGEAQLGRVTQEPAGRRQGDSRHGQARAGVEGWGRRQQKEREKKSGRPKSRRKGGVDSPVRDTRKIDVTPDGNKQREPKVRLPASRLSGSAVAELRRRELARLGMAWRSPAPRWARTRQGPDRPRPPRALPVILGQGQVQLLFRWPFPAGRLCPWRAFQTIENQPHLTLTGNISIEF